MYIYVWDVVNNTIQLYRIVHATSSYIHTDIYHRGFKDRAVLIWLEPGGTRALMHRCVPLLPVHIA